MVRIMLCDLKSATFTIAKVNEDAYGTDEHCAWVLDGSTGLNGKRLVAAENGSDAQWYSAAFSEFLKRNFETSELSLPQLFSQGVREVWAKFEHLAGGFVAKEDVPCTLGAAIRLKDGYLEYVNVGDCTLIVRKKDGSVEEYSDTTLCAMDNNTLRCALQIAEEKQISMRDVRPHILPELRRVRMTMNTPQGYISLASNAETVLQAKNGRIALDEIQDICLLSDGFAQYYKLFHLASDAAQMIEKVSVSAVEDLFAELIAAQNEDASMMAYPRFKLSDDATIVYAKIK